MKSLSRPATTVTEAARALVAQRRRVPLLCRQCGQSFVGLSHSRFCSPACRTKWHNHELNERRYQERHARKAEQARHQQEEQEERRAW